MATNQKVVELRSAWLADNITATEAGALAELCERTGLPQGTFIRLGLRIVLDAARRAKLLPMPGEVNEESYSPGLEIELGPALMEMWKRVAPPRSGTR